MPPVLLFLFQTLILIAVPFAICSIPIVRRSIPLVVMQILLGVALGPTFLARIAPDIAQLVMPAASLERLSGIAWLAAVTFTFITGLHLDIAELAGKGRAFFTAGALSLITPFIFGIGVGIWAISHVPELMGPKVSEIGFVAAIGISVSATALPVLGAILRETGWIRGELGRLALGYAALNDVLLWILIIFLTAMTGTSNNQLGTVVAIVPSALVYFGVMAFVAKPLLARFFDPVSDEKSELNDGQIVLVASILIASALLTEAMGLHYLIGAFSAGLVIPKSARTPIMARFEPLAVFVLLPFYFVVTGLKVVVDIGSSQLVLFFVLATLAAMGGKILGTMIPARIEGRPWRDAVHLGVLMQCKGFVEVVILTVLFDAGMISNAAFSALILMALVTTALTIPMAHAIGEPGSNAERVATSGALKR